jgi:hypothetical protein
VGQVQCHTAQLQVGQAVSSQAMCVYWTSARLGLWVILVSEAHAHTHTHASTSLAAITVHRW